MNPLDAAPAAEGVAEAVAESAAGAVAGGGFSLPLGFWLALSLAANAWFVWRFVGAWWRGRKSVASIAHYHTLYLRVLDRVLERDYAPAVIRLADIAREGLDQKEVFLILARLYRELGEVDRAIKLHQALVIRPDLEAGWRRMALLELARDFRAAGQPHLALDALADLQREAGDWEDTHYELYRLHLAEGRHEAALDHLRRYAAIARKGVAAEEAELDLALAGKALTAGNFSEAQRHLQKVPSQGRAGAEAALLWGRRHEAKGETARALDRYREAVRLYPQAAERPLASIRMLHKEAGDEGAYERDLDELFAPQRGTRTGTALFTAKLDLAWSRGDRAGYVRLLKTARDADYDGDALKPYFDRVIDDARATTAPVASAPAPAAQAPAAPPRLPPRPPAG